VTMNYPQKKLIEICTPKQWPTIPMKNLGEEGFPVYGANGIIGYYHEYNHENPTIMITCRGATCGTVNVCTPKSYVTGNAMCLDNLNEEIVDLGYLRNFLMSRGFNDVITGSAQPQITRTNLSRIMVSLPPLEEQKKITDILDKTNEIKKDMIIAIENRGKILHSLFHEMFGDLVNIDKGWEKILLGAHIKIKHGYAFKSQFFTTEGDFVLLTPGNFWEKGGYKDRGEKQPYYTGEIPDGYILSKNDLVVAMTEQAPGLLGSTIIISEDNRFLQNQRLGLVTYDKDKLDLYFLYFLFNSKIMRDLIQLRSTGTKVKHTSPTKMEEIEVTLPPIELQKEFSEYCSLENNNSDNDISKIEELALSITQELLT